MAERKRRNTNFPEIAYTPFQEWIQPLMRAKGWNSARLADEAGKQYPTVWRIVQGNPAKYPTLSIARPGYELCLALGRAIGDETGALRAAGHPIPEVAGGDPLEDKRAALLADLKTILNEETTPYSAEVIRVPFIGYIAAGMDTVVESDYTGDFVPVFVGMLPSKAADLFAFRVRGFCLAGAAIIPEDVLICQPAQEATTGEIVVVEENGERMAKRYRVSETGRKTLETDPLDGEPEIVSVGESARIIGVVKLIQRIPAR